MTKSPPDKQELDPESLHETMAGAACWTAATSCGLEQRGEQSKNREGVSAGLSGSEGRPWSRKKLIQVLSCPAG